MPTLPPSSCNVGVSEKKKKKASLGTKYAHIESGEWHLRINLTADPVLARRSRVTARSLGMIL